MRRPKGPAKKGDLWITRVVGGVKWVWLRHRWFGLSLPVPVPSCAYCGCGECSLAELEIEEMKKPSPKIADPSAEVERVEVPKLLAKLPSVAELLVQPTWDDKDSKGDRTVWVCVSRTLVKLLFKVEKPPLKVMVSGRSWDEAWAAAEAMFRGDDVPWEQPEETPQKSKKKK